MLSVLHLSGNKDIVKDNAMIIIHISKQAVNCKRHLFYEVNQLSPQEKPQ